VNRAILTGIVIVGIAVMLSQSTILPSYGGGFSISVSIDIKPGSDPNSINTRSMGLVPVAILGSAEFDVNDVDVTTLEFGTDDATPKHNGHLEDVNNDGFIDLVTHYVQKDTGIKLGDNLGCLSGITNGGVDFGGCDSVVPI
jgi:hypothetical protein